MSQSLTNFYPPLGLTVAEEVRILERWDDDAVFRRYLQCQPEPTEVMEYGRIRARVKCVRARIRDLNILRKQIEPRQSSYIDADLAKVLFRRKVLAWHMFLINQLPVELLVEIFRYVVLGTHVMRGEDTQKLRLTWVCRHFREVALADGVLWSRIVFTDPPPWTRSLTFFSRTGEAPIDLCVNDITFPNIPALDRYQVAALVERFLTKARNIRSIVFSLTDWVCPWFVLRFLSEVPMPRLEYFQLDRSWEPYLWSPAQFRNPVGWESVALCAGAAPNLQKLFLNGISVNWDTVHTAKLRALDIRRLAPEASPTLQQFRALLQAPNLMKIYLHSAVPQFPEGQHLPEPIHMRNLRELRLGDMNCVSVQNILRSIHAPDIRILALYHMLGEDYTPLFELLTGRFPKVQVLTASALQIENNDVAKRHAIRWFDSMPDLRVLKAESLPNAVLFSCLLDDPWKHRDRDHPYMRGPPDPSDIDKMNTLLPDLHTLVVDKVTAADLMWFTKERDMDGHPFSLVTVPEQIWKQWTPLQQSALAFLDKRLQLIFNHPHNVTKEEADIRVELDEESLSRLRRMAI
ncbi:hypothetical protein DAEQUDRAFT_18240 [Daedalea quercina L-15889]|uniref:F-box domain-containing protein n=1 Tax=Daedalea quercina L-15889 TaxID=1314783 RepID=A0A165UKC8_9APHY|nr:hypothetical protein DAEQUDRAFT_18240 [Daedalea quercina L-15889]